MEWWAIVLSVLGLVAVVAVAFIAFVFLEAAFSNWAQEDLDGYDDDDDLDRIFRKKNYGD